MKTYVMWTVGIGVRARACVVILDEELRVKSEIDLYWENVHRVTAPFGLCSSCFLREQANKNRYFLQMQCFFGHNTIAVASNINRCKFALTKTFPVPVLILSHNSAKWSSKILFPRTTQLGKWPNCWSNYQIISIKFALGFSLGFDFNKSNYTVSLSLCSIAHISKLYALGWDVPRSIDGPCSLPYKLFQQFATRSFPFNLLWIKWLFMFTSNRLDFVCGAILGGDLVIWTPLSAQNQPLHSQ